MTVSWHNINEFDYESFNSSFTRTRLSPPPTRVTLPCCFCRPQDIAPLGIFYSLDQETRNGIQFAIGSARSSSHVNNVIEITRQNFHYCNKDVLILQKKSCGYLDINLLGFLFQLVRALIKWAIYWNQIAQKIAEVLVIQQWMQIWDCTTLSW